VPFASFRPCQDPSRISETCFSDILGGAATPRRHPAHTGVLCARIWCVLVLSLILVRGGAAFHPRSSTSACAGSGGMGSDDEPVQPVLFCAHGGGPLPLIGQQPAYLAHFKRLPQELSSTPRSILVISAHWEEETPTVSIDESNSLLFDYYGFPRETYEFKWPASGSPALAKRVCELLAGAGVDCKTRQNRGLDHGVFVPLMAGWPKADVPVVQLSLVKGHDPLLHTRYGSMDYNARAPHGSSLTIPAANAAGLARRSARSAKRGS